MSDAIPEAKSQKQKKMDWGSFFDLSNRFMFDRFSYVVSDDVHNRIIMRAFADPKFAEWEKLSLKLSHITVTEPAVDTLGQLDLLINQCNEISMDARASLLAIIDDEVAKFRKEQDFSELQ